MNRKLKLPVLALVTGLALAGTAADEQRLSRRLRGYGATSAAFADGTVTIDAESPEKAKLWAARYLHVHEKEDRVVKPGVVKLPDGTYSRVSVDGRRVTIAHGTKEPAPSALGQLPKIPMFLNSWDDYCFRFYYWPGMAPNELHHAGPSWKDYDPRAEFDFAKSCDDAGFVFWCDSQPNVNAKGLMDTQQWTWAYGLARERHLPIVFNTNFSVPYWYLNEHRELNEEHAPDFVGSYHSVGEPYQAGPFLSWAATAGHREALGAWQEAVAKFNCDEVIELLEPHGELNHGDYTVFIEHGPAADRSFRTYLRERYKTPAAVAKRWRDRSVRAWGDCRLPEIADFAGWGPDAVDLKGDWRGHPLESESGAPYPVTLLQDRQPAYRPADPAWLQPGFDDSSWPLLYRDMPGNGIGYTYEKRPAVIRRTVRLPARKGRTWLYLWDLSQAVGNPVAAYVNGKPAGRDRVRHGSCHWMVCEVTDLLVAGDNVIAFELPHGVIGYRVYLTSEEPKAYPYFGEGMNAKWVDFCGWQEWSRMRAVEAGLEAHRAVEPDKSIVAMAPATYFNSMRELAKRYGSRFHDTGMTAACYWEYLAMLMRSADMPVSCEPGGPAADLPQFKRYFNLYLRTGINAVHYFIHVGSIMWKDDIRKEFERILPAIKMMGRMSLAKPDVAFVMDSRIETLMGFPWRNDPNSAFASGYGEWRLNETLKEDFQIDAVTPQDVSDALVARYPFLIDCNNTVMTPAMTNAIERYVRAGGTYVAMFQSGRHTPETPDRWLLDGLTGCHVKRMSVYTNKFNDWGVSLDPDRRTKVRVAPAGEAMNGTNGAQLPWEFWSDGATLEADADDVETLYRWCDGENEAPGSPAVVSRRLGKGRVVTCGVRLRFYDQETRALGQILAALGARRIPVVPSPGIHARHYETTDGVSDVWLFANERENAETPYEIRFRDGVRRELVDVVTGKPVPEKGTLGPNDFILATSPRESASQAAAAWHWVRNQFGWWRGAAKSPAAVSRPEPHPDVVELGTGPWSVEYADGRVVKRPVGPWVVGTDIPAEVTDYVCTREITVPADWTDGEVELWGVGQYAQSFCPGPIWVYLNGQEVCFGDGGVPGRVLPLKPGEKATLAIKVQGDRHPGVRGFRGTLFLFHRPRPAGELSLAGEWEVFERMTDVTPHTATLPGHYDRGVALHRTFTLPAEAKGRTVSIDFAANDFSHGVVVNGHFVRRHHHRHGDRTVLNITPWLKPGAENDLWIVGNYFGEWARSGDVRHVKLVW